MRYIPLGLKTTWVKAACMYLEIKTWNRTTRQVANFKKDWAGEHSLKDLGLKLGNKNSTTAED